MNGIQVTRFADFSNSVNMAKQLADAVNRIEKLLQAVPLYFGTGDPNGVVSALAGAVYVRTGDQGVNPVITTPKLYLKVVNEGSSGWLALLYTGTQAQTDVTADRGSLYIKVPAELASAAAIYFKQTEDASKNGWAAL